MKWIVFIGPESFTFGRRMWKLLSLTMAHSQFGCSALCSLFAVGQTPVWTAGQMCTVLRKAVPLAKWIMAAARDKSDACVILQSWYFHLLVGCNRITGGSGWAEDRPKGDCRHQEHRLPVLEGDRNRCRSLWSVPLPVVSSRCQLGAGQGGALAEN